MMDPILKARMLEEARLSGVLAGHKDIDDRGSDAGSCMCMEFLDDDLEDGVDIQSDAL